MRCRHVHERLVAYQDRELAPAEHTRVQEHLDGCEACAQLEQRLRQVTPKAFLDLEPSASQWAALDERLDQEWDRVERSPRLRTSAWHWVWEEARLPPGAVVAYAAMLFLAVAWGAKNWYTAQQLQVALAEQVGPATAAAPPVGPGAIEPDHFVPASWTPDAE